MKFLSLIIFCTVIGFLIARPSGEDGASGKLPERITARFFGVEPIMANPSILAQYLPVIQELGVGIVGVNGLSWGLIEPTPPSNGMHSYLWPDELFKLVYDYGLTLQVNLICLSPWGTIHSDKQTPPKPEHWDNFRAFVYNFIERYDGDGFQDAWEMRHPVIAIINIGSEIENKGRGAAGFWNGTAEDYNQVQKVLFEESRRANPDIIVARGATNFGNFFDDDPDDATVIERLKTAPEGWIDFFDSTSMKTPQYYDMFGFHFNHYYTGMEPAIKWVQQRMKNHDFSKPFYSEDTRSARVNSTGILPPFYPDRNANGIEDILEILDNPEHPEYPLAKAEYYRDQAILTVKKLTIGLALHLNPIIISTITDWLTYGDPDPGPSHMRWRHSGLIDTRIAGHDGHNLSHPEAKKPAYYSLQLLIQKLTGAHRDVEILNLGESIYAFRFHKGNHDIFILWHENPQSPNSDTVRISLRPYIDADMVKVTSLITTIGDTVPYLQKVSVDNIPISHSPIFIEKLTATSMHKSEIPDSKFTLYQNHPNPFNLKTTIRFYIPKRNHVTLKIFDILGNNILTLVDQELPGGMHTITFNANNLSSGIYFYRLQAGKRIIVKKLFLLK